MPFSGHFDIEEDAMTRLSRRTTIAYSFGQLGSGLYGAFNKSPLTVESREYIFVARRG